MNTTNGVPTSEINYADIETYFKFLAPNDNLFTVAFLDAAGNGACSPYGTFTGPLDRILQVQANLYAKCQATLHVTINQTNDAGKKKKDITAARVLAVDLDTPISNEDLQGFIDDYSPNLVVQTSPGKYHLYWSIESTIPLDRWSNYQLILAYKFQADWRLHEINKTLRVPGVPRITKAGEVFVPSIVYSEELPPLSEVDLLDLFPFLATDYDAAVAWKKGLQDAERRANKALRASLNGASHGGTLNGSGISVPDGASRNTSLYKLAFHEMARFVPGAPALTEDELLETVSAANQALQDPLDDTEIEGIVRSAYDGGLEEWEKSKGTYEATQVEPSGFEYDFEGDEFLRISPYSHMALVSRILQRFSDRLLRVGRNVYAFHPFERVWQLQEVESPELNLFYRACVNDMLSEPGFIQANCLTNQGDFSHKKHQNATEKALALNNYKNVMLGVRAHHALTKMDFAGFDGSPNLLHVANGVVDMLTGELREATPEDRLLNRSPLTYSPDGECPRFIEFLHEVFAENEDPAGMVAFMQRLFGYSISGSISEQKLFLHYGSGSNGKSKVLSAFRHILGDYVSIVDPDEFAMGKFGAVSRFERLGVKMEGKRCVVIDDMETSTVWNETFVKNCTSPQIRARAEHQKSREITNRSKLHIGLNEIPKPQTEIHALFRRLCILNYPRQFEANTRESDRIDAMILQEREGILAWAVQGYRLWSEEGGLQLLPEMEVSLQEYKEEHSVLPRFLREHFMVGDSGTLNEALVLQVTELLKSQPGAANRRFGKNEILAAVRSAFDIKPSMLWDPSKQKPGRGYRVIAKSVSLE